jgi:CheY-like chemotaxis protein
MVVTAAIRDITQRREVDKLLREARDIADVANQAKSAFLAHMSHEIRTPIGIILGYVDALDNAATDEERSTYVDRLRKNAENLLELINDILDLSKVESGKIDIEHRRFKLVPFVSETVGSLRSRANAKATELSITWRDGVPETIDTDETRLRQVLINVLANAIKFTDQGSVSIDVALVPQANDRGERSMLQFLVKDTGCGIATASHKRIFDPFVQAESYTTRKHGGTGLGLSLSQRLAEALGGDVHLVRSELGAGSTFAVTIDPGDLAATTLINVVGEFRPAKRINGRSASSSSALSGMRVLLVEDAPDNQLIVKMFLTLRGASVDIANDGREGVAKAIQGDYHLVLMDIQMPNLNGYDATAALRRQGYARPIVALTAHAMKGERERCLEVGFDDYLTKPIERDELTALVSKFKPRSVAPGEAEATH